jgi:hypothetical protein
MAKGSYACAEVFPLLASTHVSGRSSGFSSIGRRLTYEKGDHVTSINANRTLFLQSLAFTLPLRS